MTGVPTWLGAGQRGRALTFTEPSRGARKGVQGWGRSPRPPQTLPLGGGLGGAFE